MRQARLIGRVRFAGRYNIAELLDECSSTAWEVSQSAPPHVEAGPIAQIAVKRVAIGRHLRPSIRSIGSGWQPKKAKRPKFVQVQINLETLAAPNTDPAELACFLLDYKAWLKRLSKRHRKVAKLLATGETTRNAAKAFGVSDGRISQIRRELQTDWEKFQGEN
jgi:uncharacterized protein YerC